MKMEQKSDRYVSYKGIECEKNSALLIDLLRRHIDDPAKSNVFWDKFSGLLVDAESGEGKGFLFLIHCYINNIQELFELYGDREALDLLGRIEVECC